LRCLLLLLSGSTSLEVLVDAVVDFFFVFYVRFLLFCDGLDMLFVSNVFLVVTEVLLLLLLLS
jgi:hypothetical protein